MNDWTKYIQEGRQYLKTAGNGFRSKKRFNNELIFNLIGLSMEKLLIGLCLQRGHIPADHSMAGIVAAVDRLCPIDPMVVRAVEMMDRAQDLCSLEVNVQCKIGDKQIETLLNVNEQVALFVNHNLTTAASEQVAAQ